MSLHNGHRARKRKQFNKHGLDAFADHEALELLLFYAIPRRDVNPVAHRLLERFGSLDGVFSAPFEELVRVEGVGESAATLLRLLFPLCRRVRTAAGGKPVILDTTGRAGAYFLELFFGEKQEKLYEACLDAKGKLLSLHCLSEGNVDRISINMRKLVENALAANASAVILAHNHPSGIALPSGEDNLATLQVRDALRAVGVQLADHIIAADEDFVSLRQSGILDE